MAADGLEGVPGGWRLGGGGRRQPAHLERLKAMS